MPRKSAKKEGEAEKPAAEKKEKKAAKPKKAKEEGEKIWTTKEEAIEFLCFVYLQGVEASSSRHWYLSKSHDHYG